MLFQGTYEHTLDAKGRVSMPGDFRHAIGAEQRLVIARNLDPGCQCLTAFPLPEWQAFVERLGAHADFDPNAIKLNRLVMSGAVECAIDKQGRVLILQYQAGMELERYLELIKRSAQELVVDLVAQMHRRPGVEAHQRAALSGREDEAVAVLDQGAPERQVRLELLARNAAFGDAAAARSSSRRQSPAYSRRR